MESEHPVPGPTHVEVTPQNHQPSESGWHIIAEFIRTVLIVAVLAYCIRLFVLQPFVVEGSSMAPRFHTNDFLIVDKVSYRLHTPDRGDIVVFEYPGDTTGQTHYVKRMIGLPGDTITIADGKVTVSNADHPEGVVLEEPYVTDNKTTLLPNGSAKMSFTVPNDHYFVLGDNRPASSDSRDWGFVPKDRMIGRVMLEAFPIAHASIIKHADYPDLD